MSDCTRDIIIAVLFALWPFWAWFVLWLFEVPFAADPCPRIPIE